MVVFSDNLQILEFFLVFAPLVLKIPLLHIVAALVVNVV